MSSFRYHLVRAAARLMSHRNIYRMDAPRLAAFLEKFRARRNPGMPGWIRRKYAARTETVAGRPVHVIAPKDAASGGEAALLYLHGGGFIMEAHAVHWRAVSKIVNALGIAVWFPAYPLLSGKPGGPSGEDRAEFPSMREIAEMILAVYRRVLDVHNGGNIVLAGDSAGAALSLALCHHIRAEKLTLPAPKHIMLVSPAQPVETDRAVLAAMRKIEDAKSDVMLSLIYMKSIAEITGMDGDPGNYFDSPLYGDFSGFPPIDLYAGTGDVTFPQAEALAERVRRSGTEITFHRGENMMHVWPLMPAAPECTNALEEIIDTAGRALSRSGGAARKK